MRAHRPDDPIDVATAKLNQAHAILTMMYGDSFEGIDGLSTEIKANVNWCCAMLIEEAFEILFRGDIKFQTKEKVK